MSKCNECKYAHWGISSVDGDPCVVICAYEESCVDKNMFKQATAEELQEAKGY